MLVIEGEKIEFADFVEGQNRKARYDALRKGLGIRAPNGPDVQDQVKNAIDRVLDENGLKELSEGGLSALITREIRPLLRKDEAKSSMLDLVTLGHVTDDEITKFLGKVGVNIDDPENINYIKEVFARAIRFYDEIIANSKKTPPINPELRKVQKLEGIYDIFKTASGQLRRQNIKQACGLLRIAAAVDFKNRDPYIRMIPKVKDELEKIATRHVRQEKRGGAVFYDTMIEGEEPIPLVRFEKRSKTDDRIIAKLLHKPDSSTSKVLDHIGFRLTTRSAADTLKLIYKMFFDSRTAVLPFVSIRIGRTKQRMFDVALLQEGLSDPIAAAKLFAALSDQTINHQDVDSESVDPDDRNAFSSPEYRAIHITVDLPIIVDGERYFFPIEFQFCDHNAMIRRDKLASHESYLADQMDAVRERVTGNNLDTVYRELSKKETNRAAT